MNNAITFNWNLLHLEQNRTVTVRKDRIVAVEMHVVPGFTERTRFTAQIDGMDEWMEVDSATYRVLFEVLNANT